jgi:succinyldiaminopimelate transaminase
MTPGRLSLRLPEFPWDSLHAARRRAEAHPDGIVDLSIGTPVDPTPEVVQAALRSAADAPGYPLTAGTPGLREAIAHWLQRRVGASNIGPDSVLPTVGSKEIVATLPMLLGVGAGDTVVIPELGYPTYEVGARLVGADVVRSDSVVTLGPTAPRLVWLNSPSNPTGRILPTRHLAKMVAWARERGTLLVSDECYLELGWDADAVSVLHPDVCGGSSDGVLAVHSLSKRSNLAGYRAGFVAGDAAVVAELLAVRKNLGCMVPTPVQAAMTAALADDRHVAEQRARYLARRTMLLSALKAVGLRVDDSDGGLYLWATRDEPCRDTVDWFAARGILVAPGEFYGPAGRTFVRLALTATDERIAAAAARLHTTFRSSEV